MERLPTTYHWQFLRLLRYIGSVKFIDDDIRRGETGADWGGGILRGRGYTGGSSSHQLPTTGNTLDSWVPFASLGLLLLTMAFCTVELVPTGGAGMFWVAEVR